MASPGRQKNENRCGNHESKKSATLLSKTASDSDGQTQLHFIHVFKFNLNNALSHATATNRVFLGKGASKDLSVWLNFLKKR
jgi:hypothetical protein